MKIKINQDTLTGAVRILIFEERFGKVYVAKPVQLELQELDVNGMTIPPTIEIGMMQGQMFLQSLSDCLGDMKIKPESQHKIEGILEARQDHLKREKLFADRLLSIIENSK